MQLKRNLLIILLVVMLIFTLQNSEVVSVRFLFWNLTLSRVLLLFLVLAVGLICGFFLGTLHKAKNRPKHDSSFPQDPTPGKSVD